MAGNQITRGVGLLGNVRIGGGDLIRRIEAGSVSVNPASIAATTKAGTAVTLAGVAVGDMVIVQPPTDLEDDLLPAGAVVTDADELTIYLYNPTGGAIDGAAKTWSYLWYDLT